MISVTEAKKLVQENAEILSPVAVSLNEASGLILAEDTFSKIDFPPFNQSNMDGYAFRFSDWTGKNSFEISGEIPAGGFSKKVLGQGEAIRIFTGAPLPEGADTVVMQEKVEVENGKLIVKDSELKQGTFVRKKGAQNSVGDLALPSGTRLMPASVAYLASIGIASVKLHPLPKVCIITTGNELRRPGETLTGGEIYECNTYGLIAALKELNIMDVAHFITEDNVIQITETVKRNLENYDIILMTGGVSFGDYDFVTKAIENCGVEKIFHGVKQKPGKPIYFGKRKQTLVFGLPGNPLSMLCCYYEYVLLAIKKIMGIQSEYPFHLQLPLSSSITKKQGLTFFVIGKISEGKVEPLPNRESYQLSSFAIADCIIELDENHTEFNAGEMVSVHLL